MAKLEPRGLIDRGVGEGRPARGNADLAGRVGAIGHDADAALPRRDDAIGVWPDEPGFRAAQHLLHADHVEHRNPLSHADDQRHLRLDRLDHRPGRMLRRHEDRGRIGLCGAHSLGDGIEDRNVEVSGAALAGPHAADNRCAAGNRTLCHARCGRSRDALEDDPGLAIDQYGHQPAPDPAMRTASRTASSMLSTKATGTPWLRSVISLISLPVPAAW